MRPMRVFYLYVRLWTQHLKAILEYQADFLIMMIAAVLTQVLGFIFLWVVFQRIPTIHGWTFWEVSFMYALIFFTEGATSFFFQGTWSISGLVNRGEMDRLLVRPVPVVLQVICSDLGMNGLGNMLTGGLIMWQALRNVETQWTVATILWSIVVICSGVAIRAAINLVSCSVVFWTRSPGNAFPFMIHSLCDFAKFPITIYSLGVQAFIALVVPYAFISFFPATYIFNKPGWEWGGLLVPVVAVYAVVVALLVFRSGLRRYESAGN